MLHPPGYNHLFTDLLEALETVCAAVCAAIIVKGENTPSHFIGDPDAAQLLMNLASVQATLTDGIPRSELPPTDTSLSAAAFIAVEALNTPYQVAQSTVIVLAGKHLNDIERMAGYPSVGSHGRYLPGGHRDQPGLQIMRNALAQQKRRFRSLIQTQAGYIWLMDANGELIEAPEQWLEIAGLSSASGPPDVATIRSALAPEAAEAFRDGWDEALRNMTSFEVIYQLPAQCPSPRWFMDRITPVLDDDHQLVEWIGASQEITELKRAEKDVEHAAYKDRLTDLLSLEGFARRLDEQLRQKILHPASPVVVIDIKALREINNTQGHDVGDEVLQEVARRLAAEIGDDGLIARTGGGEFTVLATHESQRTRRQLRECMAAVFDVPFAIRGFAFHVEASFGYTRIRLTAGDARKLMNDATLAMHISQHNPTLTWTQYTKTLEHQTRKNVDITMKLRHAIAADQLALYYQPQVDLASGRIVSTEALLRWQHPHAGFIPPDQFIPLAEQSQLIGPIGDWVIRQACRDLRAWHDAGIPVTPVSINLSLIQFQLGSVPNSVHKALSDYNIAPALLTLEITESVFEQHCQALQYDLEALSAMGVRLSLDDFGTGYSSLGHLKDYFFNEIKIDKSFISQLDGNPYPQAIVKAVIVIAEAIGADVVAEGLELTNQIAIVRQLGCSKGQGYHYSRPVPELRWRQLLIEQTSLG